MKKLFIGSLVCGILLLGCTHFEYVKDEKNTTITYYSLFKGADSAYGKIDDNEIKINGAKTDTETIKTMLEIMSALSK